MEIQPTTAEGRLQSIQYIDWKEEEEDKTFIEEIFQSQHSGDDSSGSDIDSN